MTGKIGADVAGRFRLETPAVQVFEKKAKPEATTSATVETQAPAVAATPPVVEAQAPVTVVVKSPIATIGQVKLTLKGKSNP